MIYKIFFKKKGFLFGNFHIAPGLLKVTIYFLLPSLREPFKNYLADFFVKGGGGTPPSAKLFWAQWLSVKGGGEYPPIPLRENSAKKQLFLAKQRLF